MADPDTAPEYAAGVLPHARHARSEDGPGGAASPRAWWLFASIAAFVSAGRLDRALATGADPRVGVLLEHGADVALTAQRVAIERGTTYILMGTPKPRSAMRRLIEPALPFRLLGLLPGVDLRIVADRTRMTKEEDG